MKLPASGLTRTYTASALWTGGGAGAVSFIFFHSVYDLILHNFNAIIKGIFF